MTKSLKTSAAVMALAAMAGGAFAQDRTEVRIAYDTIPPSIDPHMSTAYATMDFAAQIFEPLVTLNADYEPELVLAESIDVSEDGKTYTITLREGVTFHNGEPLTADDAVASMQRWKERSILARGTLSDATFEKVDDMTLALKLAEPAPLTLSVIGNPMQFAGIMPEEIVANAPAQGVTEYVGTGPYRVENWDTDQEMHLAKFEDYSSLDTPPNGLAGAKEPGVDDVYMEIVTDDSTRVSGLRSGQYDIALRLPHDNADQIVNDEALKIFAEDYAFLGMFFNKKHGPFSDIKLRQAVSAALNMEEILYASLGNDRFFSLEHSLAAPSQVLWYNDAGEELYNQDDADKARRLIEESSYDGEELRFLVSRAYPLHFYAAIVVQQQLQEVGLNVELAEYDWATLLEYRADPEAWDLFASEFTFEPTPINAIFLHSKNEYAGWTDSPEIDRLVEEIRVTEDQDEALELFKELQTEVMEYAPYIRYGNYKPLHGLAEEIEGFTVSNNIILSNLSVAD
ncbi:ABC transporter substrate-binding protein [Roseivivax sediminis]|uniref:Peptide/nickel transport system substrate-binding protein n=1 Tax=Roseivivax sediminis TaxID=936889 RepID=A0A1I1V9P0_9RHOB|nr:ABC transporter substrate-binding protein [Roseivivax sediminis]SFD79781.1 peptide/nickel transport system substrate-binding protein [Roseivivax sediminis]